MSEQLANFAFTTVGLGGYTAASGFLNVLDTATGSGIQPFPSAANFSIVICNPPAPTSNGAPKTLLEVTAINSGTQFAVTNNGITPDVNCNPGDFVYCVQDKRSLRAITSRPFVGYVATDESTASTTYTDLATLDTITFTLDFAFDVMITYMADGYQVGGSFPGNLWNIVNIDGSDVSGTDAINATVAASYEEPNICKYLKTALSAGAHTVKIRHKTTSGTAHWLNRILSVQPVN